MITLPRPIQRAGHIADDDNRFCGASVFAELAPRGADGIDLLARAVGLPDLGPIDRDVLRMLGLALTSPDARVWPLKLARTLAAHGSAVAGYHGAQLASASTIMGPGTASRAAAFLAWLRTTVGDDAAPEGIADVVAGYIATNGKLAGFGVPLRPEDERVLGLRALAAGHAATRRPHWRLAERLIDVVRARDGVEPNIVLFVAAGLLDLGLLPHRAGMFLGMLMTHTFAAHAVEAADHDGPHLRELPRAALDDRTAPRRRTPAAEAIVHESAPRPALGAAGFGPRRSLAW